VTANGSATLVWIAPAPPDAAEARALDSWARAHGLTLEAPRDERPPALPVGPPSAAVADQIEELLDRARDATAARDGDSIDRATHAAEDLLRAHPELPQAAWLMAEVERARSTRWSRVAPMDPEAAEREWVRAAALDGGRMPGLGEVGARSPPADAQLLVAIPGGDEARLDGQRTPSTGAVATHAGPHSLVVTVGGAPVWAEWIETPPGTSTFEADAPVASPCSTVDAAQASMTTESGAAGESLRVGGVRCARWVAGAPGPTPGTLRIASCEGARCGPLLVWRDVQPWAASPVAPSRIGHDRHWPGWATWVLTGAGVAVATGIVIAASGALQPAPTETRFVTGGLKTQ
jgi:hypothetical protein